MDEATGRRVCSIIAGVLHADGDMSPEESAFFKRALGRCGLDTDTAVMAAYMEDVAGEVAQLDEPTRWAALDLAVEAAAADGSISPGERAIVDVLAKALGLSEERVIARLGQALDDNG